MRRLIQVSLVVCAIWFTKGSVYVDAKQPEAPRVCSYIKENHAMMDVQQEMLIVFKGLLDDAVDYPVRREVILKQYSSHRKEYNKLIKKLKEMRKAHHTIYDLNCNMQEPKSM